MIKNSLIKSMSLTIAVMSVTLSNSIYANAEDNINVEQMKSEIVNEVSSKEEFGFDATKDELEFQGETTVKKEFNYEDINYTNVNLTDEKLYYFRNSKYNTISFYYGLTSKYVYEESRGTGGGDLIVLKDGNIYAGFDFCGGNNNLQHGWFGWNGWYHENDYWNYFKDGIAQTGWVYDKGKWYYCYSNGEMAHDTTIDGYKLGSDGAWTN